MATTTLESIGNKTEASSETERFVDKLEAIEKPDSTSLFERGLDQGSDDEYVPPRHTHKARRSCPARRPDAPRPIHPRRRCAADQCHSQRPARATSGWRLCSLRVGRESAPGDLTGTPRWRPHTHARRALALDIHPCCRPTTRRRESKRPAAAPDGGRPVDKDQAVAGHNRSLRIQDCETSAFYHPLHPSVGVLATATRRVISQR